jgi:hypothetical protein
MVILATARHYTCHYIWFNHVELALNHGVSQQAIDDIKHGRAPRGLQDDEATAHQFAIEVLGRNSPTDLTLDRARRAFGDRGVIEMGARLSRIIIPAQSLSRCRISRCRTARGNVSHSDLTDHAAGRAEGTRKLQRGRAAPAADVQHLLAGARRGEGE